MKHEEFIEPIPGKIMSAYGEISDLGTLLCYWGKFPPVTVNNDGRVQPECATYRVDGKDYDLYALLHWVGQEIYSNNQGVATLSSRAPTRTLTNASGATGITTKFATVDTVAKLLMGTVLAQDGAGTQTFAAPKAIEGVEKITVTLEPGQNEEPNEVHEINLSSPLYGMSDAEDSIRMDDVLVTRKTKHIVLDGTEAWTAGEADAAPYVLTLADKKVGTTNFACSHSIPAGTGTTAGTCVGSAEDGTITFYPPAGEDYDTLDEWKAALAAQAAGDPEADPEPIDPTPVQLVYELNEAVSEVDSGAWEGFSLWDDTTKITHDGGGALSVNYLLDMNAVVADLETRLALVEAAIET